MLGGARELIVMNSTQ